MLKAEIPLSFRSNSFIVLGRKGRALKEGRACKKNNSNLRPFCDKYSVTGMSFAVFKVRKDLNSWIVDIRDCFRCSGSVVFFRHCLSPASLPFF
jgi:hypothetical protein